MSTAGSKQLSPRAPPAELRWRAWVVRPRREASGPGVTTPPTKSKRRPASSRSLRKGRPRAARPWRARLVLYVQRACNALQSTSVPSQWENVWAAWARSRRGKGEEQSSASRERGGGRHPAPRGDVDLRGSAEERGSWSVRRECHGARSLAGGRTGDRGCPLDAEEGNVVSVRQAPALDVVARSPRPRVRGRVLRSVQRPVHVYPHSTRGARAPRGGAIDSVSRSGKPARAGGTGTGALTIGRLRGSPRVNRSLGDQGGLA